MSGYLLDTNVISEFVKPQPNSHVLEWLKVTDPQLLFASVVTVGEIRLGIENLPTGKRRAGLEQWLAEGLPEWFEANLLPITKAIAERWARVTIEGKRQGVTVGVVDGLIAATPLHHGLTIVTHNVKDFEWSKTAIVDPWKPRLGI